MKFIDVINSPQLSGYFRKRSDKWIAEFSALVSKGKISDLEIGEKKSQAKQLKIIKLSWLGFFLNHFLGGVSQFVSMAPDSDYFFGRKCYRSIYF